ncbi:hypothetical protein Riv7116_2369 [Rivularia sp. PCC 7116]|nr:hypothetical protein Riv7116_2369 [Rivularia sp. PCC 7116]
MSSFNSNHNSSTIYQWQQKIKIANHNNIFCHCRDCNYEWVDSVFDAICHECGSANVEAISCWQFPDG